ncbi:hypothetical protein [Acinetobacter baumannii]|uniref:hypothetical protein n=2 Tax=Acinetobacter baumannii TaxID=470 RepID=UPI001660946A|nr:hypothetical protein [Acinetobacter baumannii]MBD0482828.1 hypothetical protein [Acinetobacter baumannii]HEM7080266.1 hypothetical protein [Acinetobacter baumannii]
MDKCREEFEVIARSNGWNLTTYPEITERIDYVNNLTEQAWQMYQHQQAKVEELEGKLKQAYEDVDTFAEAHERECGFKAQLAKDKAELQKRVEWLEDRLKATDTLSKMRAAVIGSFNTQEFNARTRRKMMILKQAEQALKGEG